MSSSIQSKENDGTDLFKIIKQSMEWIDPINRECLIPNTTHTISKDILEFILLAQEHLALPLLDSGIHQTHRRIA